VSGDGDFIFCMSIVECNSADSLEYILILSKYLTNI
jgi:hypothetical protein